MEAVFAGVASAMRDGAEEIVGTQVKSKTYSGQTAGEFMAVPHLPQKTYEHLTKLL